VNRVKKHDVNLKKNSRLYFQIGLIVVLLVSYVVVEAQFKVSVPDIPPTEPIEGLTYTMVEKFEVEKEVKIEPKIKKVKFKNVVDFKIGDPEKDVLETFIDEEPTQGDPDAIFDPTKVEVVEADGPVPEIPISVVEIKPIFPGCENAINKAQCMQEKIDKIINRKFNTEVAEDYNLKGKQTIYVSFKIDQHGFVTQIAPLVRGKNASKMSPKAKNALELEAKRAVAALPKFIPGIQDKKPVIVPYVVPITFVVTE
jgi:protein TonB